MNRPERTKRVEGLARSSMSYFVYFLKDSQNNLYIGQTNNLENRVRHHSHKGSKSAKFTRDGGDFKLVYQEEYETRQASMKRERQLKGWTRAKKEALINGDLKLLKNL